MKKFNYLSIILSSIITLNTGASYSFAASVTENTKATATLSASCTVSAQNIGFGALSLPLSAQNASSNMSVLCSQAAPYTIGLAYGGVYGQGTNGDYWVHEGCPTSCTSNYNWYYEYNSSGQIINKQQYRNGTVINGTTTTTIPGATYNNTNGTYTVGTVYSYGIMTGVAAGDKLAYYIQAPDNASTAWNTGNYTYSGTGTGTAQSIPLTATLVPSQSGSSYPTPDMYMDIVTATISF